jgi:hypothetical protein
MQELDDVIFDRVSIHYDKDGKYHEKNRRIYNFYDEEDYWEEDYDSYVEEPEHEKPKHKTKQFAQSQHKKSKTLDRMLKKYGTYIEALKKENTS